MTIEASFRKHEDKWTAGVESGQDGTPAVGSEIIIIKKDGTKREVTLTAQVGRKVIGEVDAGRSVTFWEFSDGWKENEWSVSTESDDGDEPF